MNAKHNLQHDCQLCAPMMVVVLLLVSGCGPSPSSSPTVQVERGKLLLENQRYTEALQVLNEALQAAPGHIDGYYQRGLVLERLGQDKEALRDYARALELDPGHVWAVNNRAVVLAKQGDFEEAVRGFSQAVAIDPEFVQGYKNRGLALHDLQLFEEAITSFEQALQLAEDAEGHFLRGNALLDLQRYQDAINEFSKAVEMDEGLANAWQNRGLAYWKLGKKGEARADFERASAIEDDYAVASLLMEMHDEKDRSVINLQEASDYLVAAGWSVTANDDPLLPLKIERATQEYLVWIATLSQDGSLLLNAEDADRLLKLNHPVSVLIQSSVPDGTTEWSFRGGWQPERADFAVDQVRVDVPVPTPVSDSR